MKTVVAGIKSHNRLRSMINGALNEDFPWGHEIRIYIRMSPISSMPEFPLNVSIFELNSVS
jgi:hypothetical protein